MYLLHAARSLARPPTTQGSWGRVELEGASGCRRRRWRTICLAGKVRAVGRGCTCRSSLGGAWGGEAVIGRPAALQEIAAAVRRFPQAFHLIARRLKAAPAGFQGRKRCTTTAPRAVRGRGGPDGQ